PATSSISGTAFFRRRHWNTFKHSRVTCIKKHDSDEGFGIRDSGFAMKTGVRSPLTDITEAQAAALRERLGPEIPVAIGMRNWRPFIKDALAGLAAGG